MFYRVLRTLYLTNGADVKTTPTLCRFAFRTLSLQSYLQLF